MLTNLGRVQLPPTTQALFFALFCQSSPHSAYYGTRHSSSRLIHLCFLSLPTAIGRKVRYSASVVVYALASWTILSWRMSSQLPIATFASISAFTTRQHTTTVADHHIQEPNDTLVDSSVSTSLLSLPSRAPCHDHSIIQVLQLTIIIRQSTTLSPVCSASYIRRAFTTVI